MDLVDCDDISDVGILRELNRRFLAKDIYSSIGPIIIAVNPYCSVPKLYDPSVLSKYSSIENFEVEPPQLGREEKPHVWAVPLTAYQQLRLNQVQQAIVISGESGAGKTETTKLCLQLLSHIASEQHRSLESPDRIEDKVLATNPVLESFGNAKTARNNNSSRFGKWLEISYAIDKRTKGSKPQLQGAKITPYLLEKSRVVQHASDERNYHIFYQVCANGVLDLQPAASYRYLRFSKSMKIPGVDDKKEFEETCESMIRLGFTDGDRDAIFEIIKSILLCGNLVFIENKDFEGNPAMVSTDYFALLRQIASLIGVNEDRLKNALISRSMNLRGEKTMINFSVTQAQDAVNALAKEMYGRMFSFIVNKANVSLHGESTFRPDDVTETSIGLLDIFGFEKFKTNSFEQLCINYANEKLQQYFIGYVLKKEQDLYLAESISFDTIAPIDNVDVLQLIEAKKDGIFSRLDDEIKIPKSTDETFLKKVTNDHYNSKNPNRRFIKDVKMSLLQFEIRHFAGVIRYDAQGFMEKNRDKLYDDLEEMLQSSTKQRIREILTVKYKLPSDQLSDESSSSTASASGSITNSNNSNNNSTIASRFQSQLQRLIEVLQNSQPHFIKCIKPNNTKQELQFDDEVVLTQLQYSGVLEAIQVRKSGFPIRRSHNSFWKSYWCLWPDILRQTFMEIPEEMRCKELLSHLNLKGDMIRCGKTLVFCKSEAISALESRKLQLKNECVIVLQAAGRSYLATKRANVLRQIRDDLMVKYELGLMHNRSNISVIDMLQLSMDTAINAGLSKSYTNKVKELLTRLLQVKDCLDKLDKFINKNVEVEMDLPILQEYEELSELANSAQALQIQSPILVCVQERLILIKERAEAVVALNAAVALGDEEDIRAALDRVSRLVRAHADEEFCKQEIQNAEETLRFVNEDFVRMEKAINLTGAWMKFLGHKISKASESKKKAANLNSSLIDQIESFNVSLATTMSEYQDRPMKSKAVKCLMDSIFKFEHLHQCWLNKNWTETFESVQWILDQCQSDFISFVTDPRKRQILATNWNIVKDLMDLELKIIEQDLVQNFIIPKFVDRIHHGGIVGKALGSIDLNEVDFENLANDIAETKNYTFLQNAVDPILRVMEPHLEVRGQFVDRRWEKVIIYAESKLQKTARQEKLSTWLQQLQARDVYDEGFLGEIEYFISGNDESQFSYTEIKNSIQEEKLTPVFTELEAELQIMLGEAIDHFLRNIVRHVLVAESIDDLSAVENRHDFVNFEAVFQLLQDMGFVYRSCGDIPARQTQIIVDNIKQLILWRKAILDNQHQSIFNAEAIANSLVTCHSLDNDDVFNLLKDQIAAAYAHGCALHIENKLSEYLTKDQVVFPLSNEEKKSGMQAVDKVLSFLQECESRSTFLDSMGLLQLQTQRLMQLMKALSIARTQFFTNKRSQMKPYLKDFQEILDECAHIKFVADVSEGLRNEIKAMELTIEYSEKMVALEDALSAGQPMRYFVPFVEPVSPEGAQNPGGNSNTPHSRLKSMSSEFDLMSSVTSLAVKDILKDENLMINDEEIEFRDLMSVLNMAREFQEEIESDGIEIPDDMSLLLEVSELIVSIRKNIVTTDFIVAMKSVQALLSKGYHRKVDAVAKEIDFNLYELSNSAMVVVCMTALAHGKPTGPIGLFDYKTIITNTLGETIDMAQCFDIQSARARALFDAVLIVIDLRKAQKMGDWKGVAEILDKASAQKIGRGYSEICFEEISRASVEKDNYECIQALRAAIVNEEIGCKDGFIDRESIVSKELVTALSKSAQLPEDTRGPILKGIFQLGEAVLKMRKAAKDNEDYLNELVSIVSDTFDNFRNDMDGLARPGSLQRKSSSMRSMRNTLAPRHKISFLDTSSPPGASILGLKSPSQSLRKTSQDEFSDLVIAIKRELELIKHHNDLLELDEEITMALESNGVELDAEGNINKNNINLEKLKEVMSKAEELDSSRLSLSKHLKEMKEIGEVIYEIRHAVFYDQWDTMSATLENTVGGEQGLHWPEYTRREISIARSEVENRWIITNLTAALQKDRFHGQLGEVPLVEVSNRDLQGYISTAKTLKPRTEEAVRLLAAAERVCSLRGLITIREINPERFAAAVNAIDWQNVKRSAKELLLDVQQGKCHPIVNSEARLIAEFAEDRMICFAMEQALLTGGVKGRPGRLDLSTLSTKELDRAYQQAIRSPIKTENAKILVVVCRIMLKLRETIRRAETTPQFEDAVEAWATIKVLLTEVDAQQKIDTELNCWELCDEEIDLIQRHSVVQDMKTALIESSIEASHIYHERHTYVPQEDLSILEIGTAELKMLNDELEKMVSTSREVSFQSDNLSEFVACATSLRMFRSHVIDKQWKELEKLMQEKTLRNHLNLIKQVKAEFSWITCELHNNMAINLLRTALLGEGNGASSQLNKEEKDNMTTGSSAASSSENGWNLDLLKAGSYSERNAQLYTVMEEVRKFKITSVIAKTWFEICENMYQLRSSLERRDNAVVAKCLRWFKSNGRVCPQTLKIEAQRAYELHQNDLLLHGLLQALSEGKPSGKRGEMDVSTIEVAAIESLLEQAEGIHPKIPEVSQLLTAASTVLNIRKSLLIGDMPRLQNIMDELSYEDSIPLEIIEEVAVARAELDNRIAINSLVEALSSFEDTDTKKVDFTFLSSTTSVTSSSTSSGGNNSFSNSAAMIPSLSSASLSVLENKSIDNSNSTNTSEVTESFSSDTASTTEKLSEFEIHRKSMGMSILESFNSRRYSFANRSSSNIDPETIDTDILDKGMRLAKLHGIFSEKASRLYRTVDFVRSLRLAMKRFDWAEVESIMETGKYEDNIGTIYDELASREIQAIRSQLDVRAAIVDLSKALKIGWAKCSHGLVDTSEMRNDNLEEAIERAERSIQDLNITEVQTSALMKGSALSAVGSSGSGGRGSVGSTTPAAKTGKKRVTFRDEVEEKDQQLKHQQSVSDQLTLLMRSARTVLQIREKLAVGNMEEAGSMAEEALTHSMLHYTVVEELRLYAKEINTALVSMRMAENLRLIALQGKLQPLQQAIADALSSDIHLGTDLGIICTLTRANRFFTQLLTLKEQLKNMEEENQISMVEEILTWAANVRYGDEEINRVRERLTALKQFETRCELVEDVWTFLSDERLLFRRLLQYAQDWKVASHPYSIRLNLYLKLSTNSLRTVKFMHAVRHQSLYTLITQTMRFKQQYLDLPSSQQRYRLEKFPQLRRPEDFALRMTVVSEDLKQNMLFYSDQPLPTSLTRLPPSWSALATFLFTGCIRGLEKNFFTHTDVMLVQLVNLGRRCLPLRDEIYLQLIKQMRKNVEISGVIRLWRICLTCLYHFPCSALFENYFENLLKQVAEEEFRQYRFARQAIRYLHRAIFMFGYDRILPVIDKEQRHLLKRWLTDSNYDPFLPDSIKPHIPTALDHNNASQQSMKSPPPTPHHYANNNDDSKKDGVSTDTSSKASSNKTAMNTNLSLMSLEEIIAEDLQQDTVFLRTPSPPVAPPPPTQTITGLLGLQIPVQNASLGIHSTSARLVGQAIPSNNIASPLSTDHKHGNNKDTTNATATITGNNVSIQGNFIRGVRENWIYRFRSFNHMSTLKDGGYMTRQKFAAALASTLTGDKVSGGIGMDNIDRDVFYFLLLGKKMPYRSAILREFIEDKQLFHFFSDEEAANSLLRRQWLEKHIPVSDFSSELFFSQMQSSDFVVYAERFWDKVILKMSRECLHFPFLHWERDIGTASATTAEEQQQHSQVQQQQQGNAGSRRRSATTSSTSSPTTPSQRRMLHPAASSSPSTSSPNTTFKRTSIISNNSANHNNSTAAVDISISWELYREIVLTGMKKYLQQFAPKKKTTGMQGGAQGGAGKVSAAKTLLRVAVKRLGAAAVMRRKSSVSSVDVVVAGAAGSGGELPQSDLVHVDSLYSFSGQQLLKKKQHNKHNKHSHHHSHTKGKKTISSPHPSRIGAQWFTTDNSGLNCHHATNGYVNNSNNDGNNNISDEEEEEEEEEETSGAEEESVHSITADF